MARVRSSNNTPERDSLLGAAFLLAVDTLCRTIATIEVPPGVLTALIGTPFFLWLFALARRSW